MSKRATLLATIASAVMAIALIPAMAFADQDDTAAVSLGLTAQAPEADGAADAGADALDNDALFAGYVDRVFASKSQSAQNRLSLSVEAITDGQKARAQLTSDYQRALYDYLAGKIADVAAGSATSTEFSIPLSTFVASGALKDKYYAADLGVDAIVANGAITAEANNAFNDLVLESADPVDAALLEDCPYELYWYDKTKTGGTSYSVTMACAADGNGYYFNMNRCTMTISYSVASDYSATGAAGTYKTRSDLASIQTAKQNAERIVADHAAKSDSEKLDAYRAAICDATSYNDDAAAGKVEGTNPWQLIWVFDGDPSTTVVCEGYAKAFKYLCDMSAFSNSSLACYTVSGLMGQGEVSATNIGGAHMWNIVTVNGNNYLVDVTNCDAESVGGAYVLDGAGKPAHVPGTFLFMCREGENNVGTKGSKAAFPGESSTYTDGYQFVIPSQRVGNSSTDESTIRYYYDAKSLALLPEGTGVLSTKALCAHPTTKTEQENVKAATCTTEASHDEVVYCTVCEQEVSRTHVKDGDALGHRAGEQHVENGKAATCTKDGYFDEVVRCKACNEILSTNRVTVEARGHDYVTTTVPATSSSGSYTLHKCSRCGDSYKTDISIAKAKVGGLTAQKYTGKALSVAPTLSVAGKKLVKGTDYTVTYYTKAGKKISASSIKAAGTYKVTIKAKGLYKGTLNKSFTVKPVAISKATVAKVKSQKYTGKAIKPAVTVKYAGKKLKKGTDYTVTYKNNKKVGTASIVIKGKGNFSGTKTVKFKIVKR